MLALFCLLVPDVTGADQAKEVAWKQGLLHSFINLFSFADSFEDLKVLWIHY